MNGPPPRIRGARLYVAVGLMLSACPSDGVGTSPAPPRTALASPAVGGTLVFGVIGEPRTLDLRSPLASDLTRALRAPIGPFRVADRTPGLEIVYRGVGGGSERPRLARLVVRFVQSLEIAIELLGRGELDAAALPASVNLLDRLRDQGLNAAAELSSEVVYLDFRGSELDVPARTALGAIAQNSGLEPAFVRDLGRSTYTLHPARNAAASRPFRGLGVAEVAGAGRRVQLAAPVGDELLALIQRALHDDWERHGFEVDVVTIDSRTFYGEWAATPQVDVALRRAQAGGLPPDSRAFETMDAIPLFQMASVVAWRDGVHGVEPNPGGGGPLVDADEWWVDDGFGG